MSANQPEPISVGKPMQESHSPVPAPVPPISDMDKSRLKKLGMAYIPKQLNTVPAQKQLLEMLSAVIPPVRVCLEKAYRETWPKAERGELPMNQAVAQCAYEVNTIIGLIILENLQLQQETREDKLKAWMVLDYYSYVLKPEFSKNIRNLQNFLGRHLLANFAPVSSSPDKEPTVPLPERTIPDSMHNSMNHSMNNSVQEKTVAQAQQVYVSEYKDHKRSPLPIIAAVLLVVALVGGIWFYTENYGAVAKTEQAIAAIGEVSLESEEALFAAEALYGELPEHKRGKVENKQVLLDARAEYDRLHNLVQDAVDAINAIGTVSTTSGEAIEKAVSAYEALKADDLTQYVQSEHSILVNAQSQYSNLCAKELYDSAQAQQKNGSYQAARDLYQTILDKYSDSDSASAAKTGLMNCAAALAQDSLRTGNLENAAKLLEEVSSLCAHTEDYTKAKETLDQRLKQARPHNGKIFRTNIDWGWGKLKLEATADQDALFKVVSKENEDKFILIYVQAGNTAEVRLKDGTYYVKYTTGDHWFSQDSMFGAEAPFYKSTTTYYYTTNIEGNWVYYYARTASLVKSSEDYFTGTTIKAEEF